MQQQVSPAVIVVVIIVVILVLVAMWHFIYGQQAKAPPPESNMATPGPAADEAGRGAVSPTQGEDEEEPGAEDAPSGEARSAEEGTEAEPASAEGA